MLLKISAHSVCGKKEINQDAFAIKTHDEIKQTNNVFKCNVNSAIFALADGISSSIDSEIISKNVCNWICENYDFPKTFAEFDNFADRLNYYVVDMYKERLKRLYHGGCTVSSVAFSEGCIDIFNIGDSPIYIYRDNLIKLSKEHSMAQYKKENGETINLNDENILLSYVGNPTTIGSQHMHYDIIEIFNKDKILICSDGLSKFVSTKKIEKILKSKLIKNKAQKLVNLALKKSDDNISAIVIDFVEK